MSNIFGNYGNAASYVQYNGILSFAIYGSSIGTLISTITGSKGGSGYCTSGTAVIIPGQDGYNGGNPGLSGDGLLGGLNYMDMLTLNYHAGGGMGGNNGLNFGGGAGGSMSATTTGSIGDWGGGGGGGAALSVAGNGLAGGNGGPPIIIIEYMM